MKKKVKKKKSKSKNPVLRWMCYRCYDSRSYKGNPEINAITLKCSLCDDYLIFESYTAAGGVDMNVATCSNGCSRASILRPQCSTCGEKMKEYGGTLKDLLENDPIDREIALDYQKSINKKSWWKL